MALAQILGQRGQIENNKGEPLKGGLVNIYEPNTTNRVTSYKGSDIVVANTNPVILSGSGRADIWVTRNVDVRITDKDGNLVVEELSVNPDDLGGIFDSGLIPNGSFETDADADDVPDGWLEENGGAGNNNGLDTTESTDGGQSWRTQSAGSGGGELVTENFFPVNDVDDLRVNFDLRSTVATVRNIVRVEWYDISQVFISNTDVYDSTANPPTFTSQVLTATPPTGARFAKIRIFGGTTGGILAGITFWDRFQVFYPQIVSGVFDNLTISGNDIISTNTNGDINLTPNGTGDTVVKNLEALTLAQLGFAGEVTLDLAAANDVRIRADILTATPPVAEAVTAFLSYYDQDGGDRLGQVGYVGANTLFVSNEMHGGSITLRGQDNAGATQVLLSADPDGNAQLNYNGIIRIDAAVAGQALIRSDTSTDTETRALVLMHQDATQRAVIGHLGDATLTIRNTIHGGEVFVQGEDTGGVVRDMIRGDPDGDLNFYQPSVEDLRMQMRVNGTVRVLSDDSTDTEDRKIDLTHADATRRAVLGFIANDILRIQNEVHGAHIEIRGENTGTAARVGIRFDPDDNVEIFHSGNNSINLETFDETAADSVSGAQVRGPDDTMRGIGFNLVPRQTISGGNHTLAQGDVGKLLFYDEGTNRDLVLNNDGAIAIDTLFAYFVGPNASVLTGNAGTGVTITYWDGTAWVTTAAAASITIGEGQGTIYKNTDTNYIVNGPNLAP